MYTLESKAYRTAKVPCLVLLLVLPLSCNVSTSSHTQANVKDAPDSVKSKQKTAETKWLDCKRVAWSKLVEQMKLKGNPMPGRPNLFSEKTPGAFNEADKQLTLDDRICYQAYQQELTKIAAAR
jgi:hypothetical protein